LALLAVLLLAAALRLGEPGVLEFLHDEAMLSLMAQEMAAGGGIPLTGIPSSVGIPNPPTSVYVMALPYALAHSPQVATLFVAALNVVGVGLLWGIARRWFGAGVALAAGLIYAVNPWALLYSRKIWAQDFQTPFILLALLLALYGFREGRRWAQVLCLPVLFFGLQIHFAAWALLPLFVILVLRGLRRRDGRSPVPTILVSIGLAALILLPFAVGLADMLAREPQRLDTLLNRGGGGLSLSADALRYSVNLATGLGLESWLAPQQQAELLARVPAPSALLVIDAALLLLGGWAALRRPLGWLLVAWALLPLLVFTPTWTPVYPHYFITALPAYALLLGMGAVYAYARLQDGLRRNIGRKRQCLVPTDDRQWGLVSLRLVLFTLGAGLLLTQVLWWRGLLRYVETTATPYGFGTPMSGLLAVRNALAAEDDVLVISDGFEVRYDQEAAIWPVMLRGTADCVRTITGDGLAVFPARPFAVLVAPNALPDPVNNLYRQPDAQTFPLRPGEGVYTLARFAQPPDWDAPALTPIAPAQFGGGAQLTGYHLSADRLYLEWLLPGPVAADYHYFGHLLDARGEKLAQADSILWPGRFWCAGDRVISWVALPPHDAAVTTLRVGLYTLSGEGGFANEPLLDAAGNPVAAWLDIPLPTSASTRLN
jgi:hypothetical protein